MSIPVSVRASRAVAHREHYTGELRVAQMPRLRESVGGEGRVGVDWRAGRDAAGHPELAGHIEGRLRLVCQHCLKEFDWPVAVDTRLRLVESEAEEAGLLHECEPYRVGNDVLPLREIVEDELLLALPLMPRCETCENDAATEPAEPAGKPDESFRPFAALKKLKF